MAKWSMADVFFVALFIAYVAAQASQMPPGDPHVPPPLLAFTANFGYWVAGYCLLSLATQQMTAGWFTHLSPRRPDAPFDPAMRRRQEALSAKRPARQVEVRKARASRQRGSGDVKECGV